MRCFTYPTVELEGGYRHLQELPRSRAASSNQEVQFNFTIRSNSPSLMSSPESVSHPIHLQNKNLTPCPSSAPHSSQHLKGMSNPSSARLFAHFTISPNTCASYIQGQDHSPSVIEYELSESLSICDLTALQTF
jgi:hypothetical protein